MNRGKLFKSFKLYIEKSIMFLISNIVGIDNNKIVFSSFGGKQYSDSGRVICESLHERNKKLKIVWLLNEKAMDDKYGIIPNYVIRKKNTIFNFMREVSTSSVFISNEDFKLIYKNKKQLFIDTWHGDRGFKKILHETGMSMTPVYDNKVVDYCIAGSDYGVERYRKAFLYNGKILNEGMPRNDVLLNYDNNSIMIKKKFGLDKEKVLLYAPTFRDNNNSLQNVSIDFDKVLSELSKDGNEWKLLIRSHTASKGLMIKVSNEKVVDVTDYPDMTDILKITDFLISDYSSTATDFALTKKPIILFLYDYLDYKTNCRGFIADPKDVGLIVAYNEKDLLNKIKTVSMKDYINACNMVNDYYKIHETGKSTNKICDIIIKHISWGE